MLYTLPFLESFVHVTQRESRIGLLVQASPCTMERWWCKLHCSAECYTCCLQPTAAPAVAQSGNTAPGGLSEGFSSKRWDASSGYVGIEIVWFWELSWAGCNIDSAYGTSSDYFTIVHPWSSWKTHNFAWRLRKMLILLFLTSPPRGSIKKVLNHYKFLDPKRGDQLKM